ncbi:hypothetical protein C8R46DRAFT_1035824 [Mycena filopes]|nr:hypothetical protein C8R46DRAFT_1035824 [Mycena filopes]
MARLLRYQPMSHHPCPCARSLRPTLATETLWLSRPEGADLQSPRQAIISYRVALSDMTRSASHNGAVEFSYDFPVAGPSTLRTPSPRRTTTRTRTRFSTRPRWEASPSRSAFEHNDDEDEAEAAAYDAFGYPYSRARHTHGLAPRVAPPPPPHRPILRMGLFLPGGITPTTARAHKESKSRCPTTHAKIRKPRRSVDSGSAWGSYDLPSLHSSAFDSPRSFDAHDLELERDDADQDEEVAKEAKETASHALPPLPPSPSGATGPSSPCASASVSATASLTPVMHFAPSHSYDTIHNRIVWTTVILCVNQGGEEPSRLDCGASAYCDGDERARVQATNYDRRQSHPTELGEPRVPSNERTKEAPISKYPPNGNGGARRAGLVRVGAHPGGSWCPCRARWVLEGGLEMTGRRAGWTGRDARRIVLVLVVCWGYRAVVEEDGVSVVVIALIASAAVVLPRREAVRRRAGMSRVRKLVERRQYAFFTLSTIHMRSEGRPRRGGLGRVLRGGNQARAPSILFVFSAIDGRGSGCVLRGENDRRENEEAHGRTGALEPEEEWTRACGDQHVRGPRVGRCGRAAAECVQSEDASRRRFVVGHPRDTNSTRERSPASGWLCPRENLRHFQRDNTKQASHPSKFAASDRRESERVKTPVGDATHRGRTQSRQKNHGRRVITMEGYMLTFSRCVIRFGKLLDKANQLVFRPACRWLSSIAWIMVFVGERKAGDPLVGRRASL